MKRLMTEQFPDEAIGLLAHRATLAAPEPVFAEAPNVLRTLRRRGDISDQEVAQAVRTRMGRHRTLQRPSEEADGGGVLTVRAAIRHRQCAARGIEGVGRPGRRVMFAHVADEHLRATYLKTWLANQSLLLKAYILLPCRFRPRVSKDIDHIRTYDFEVYRSTHMQYQDVP